MNNFIPFVAPSTGPRIDFTESYDKSSLKGRSALVTGGSFGIGRGLTEGLAEAGVYVTFCDVKEEEGLQAEKELREKGLKVQFVKVDVTSWSELVAAFKAAVAFSPRKTVDIVIPNAGIAGPSLAHWLAETPIDASGDPNPPPSRVVDVNYMAVYNTVHAALYYFKTFPGEAAAGTSPEAEAAETAKSKLLVMVSSMGGYGPMPSMLNYNSAKWGVRGLFWSLRNIEAIMGEGKPRFRVNLIAPTWVRTNMTKGFVSRAGAAEDSPYKIAEVSDCVDVVLRMAADENVKGRAAAIAANKQSFDLCDESEGPGVGQVLSDPEYQKRHYELPAAPASEPAAQNGAAPAASKPEQENGVASAAPVEKEAGAAKEPAGEKVLGGAVEAAPVKDIAAPVDPPREVVNAA